MLEKERAFYEKNKEDWASRYSGQFALVRGEELVGVFPTIEEALSEGARRFGVEPFLVRQVGKPQEDIHIPALTLGILNANSARSV